MKNIYEKTFNYEGFSVTARWRNERMEYIVKIDGEKEYEATPGYVNNYYVLKSKNKKNAAVLIKGNGTDRTEITNFENNLINELASKYTLEDCKVTKFEGRDDIYSVNADLQGLEIRVGRRIKENNTVEKEYNFTKTIDNTEYDFETDTFKRIEL